MLLFMHRMNLLQGQGGNHNLREDVEKTELSFDALIAEKLTVAT